MEARQSSEEEKAEPTRVVAEVVDDDEPMQVRTHPWEILTPDLVQQIFSKLWLGQCGGNFDATRKNVLEVREKLSRGGGFRGEQSSKFEQSNITLTRA